MPKPPRLSARDVRDRLRSGDPARTDRGLSENEHVRLREAIARASSADAPSGPSWAPTARLALAGIALALIVAVGVARRWPAGPGPEPATAPGRAAQRQTDAEPGQVPRASQQIHLTTSGGTRIVWTVNPLAEL